MQFKTLSTFCAELIVLIESWGFTTDEFIMKGRGTNIVLYPSLYAQSKNTIPYNFTIFLKKSINETLLKETLTRWKEAHDELPF